MIPEINLLPNEISPVTTFFSHVIFMDCMSPGLFAITMSSGFVLHCANCNPSSGDYNKK